MARPSIVMALSITWAAPWRRAFRAARADTARRARHQRLKSMSRPRLGHSDRPLMQPWAPCVVLLAGVPQNPGGEFLTVRSIT